MADLFVIRVMGPTGSGKTTFINLASGSQLRVGTGLESSTEEVQFSKPFPLDKHTVTLVDTPGFDDTTKSDAEIFKLISDHLASAYKKKRYLSGVIYLHRISDNRMGGTAMRNFRFFRQLCGDEALPNTLIVTNMWNEIDEDLGAAREEELGTKDIFFKPALDAGSEMRRHTNTTESAHNVLRALIDKQPRPLQIQREIVDERKQIYQTAAGIVLLGELAAKEQKHLQELQELQEEIEEAIREKNQEDQEALEKDRSKVDENVQKVREEQKKVREAQVLRQQASFWQRFLSKIHMFRPHPPLTAVSV
ncbi:P-loop containing nucleoside triphosphate hydrolase protein [Amylocystis lapponica]|nr:P-loop containing nucleoside triphosphate hydrolase protein [Amylocystis lapponica]